MPRPSHPEPYVRDDRETPLCVGRDGERYAGDLGQKGTGIFLRRGLDRYQCSLLQAINGEAASHGTRSEARHWRQTRRDRRRQTESPASLRPPPPRYAVSRSPMTKLPRRRTGQSVCINDRGSCRGIDIVIQSEFGAELVIEILVAGIRALRRDGTGSRSRPDMFSDRGSCWQHPIFDATGSTIAPGRWNTGGSPMIYTSEHYSTALLEKLVHGSGALPPNQHFVTVTIPRGLTYEAFLPASLPGWDRMPASVSRTFGRPGASSGGAWFSSCRAWSRGSTGTY